MSPVIRIHIVQSNEAAREALAGHLRACGYAVETCGDVETGLSQATMVGYDFVLLEPALAVAHLSRELQDEHQQLSAQKRALEIEQAQLQASARHLHVLHAFSNVVCSTLDLKAVFTLASAELAKAIPHDLCVLTLLQAPQVVLHFYAAFSLTHTLIAQLVDACITSTPRCLGQHVTQDNVLHHINGPIMACGDGPQQAGLRLQTMPHITAPLTVAGQTLGLASLYRLSGDAFTAAEEKMLGLLTTFVALALRNAYTYQKTQDLALHDGLTQLYNHAAFHDALERAFETFLCYNRAVTLIIFDIGHCKMINDTYGHQIGDSVLQELAALGLASIRKTDFLARYGGEEFGLILPDTDLAQAQILVDRLWRTIQWHRFLPSTTALTLTVSLGVAGTASRGVRGPADLVHAADAALYEAKHTGRNRWCVAESLDAFPGALTPLPARPETTLAPD